MTFDPVLYIIIGTSILLRRRRPPGLKDIKDPAQSIYCLLLPSFGIVMGIRLLHYYNLSIIQSSLMSVRPSVHPLRSL